MKPALENDFRLQQVRLLRLIDERRELVDGSWAADEADKQILGVQNLVRSYQTVKWHEQES
jgi:hypothetical protein